MTKIKHVILIEDKDRIDKLMITFFIACDMEGILRNASKGYGYGHNVIFTHFKRDVDEFFEEEIQDWGYDFPRPLDDKHVLLEFSLMGGDEVELAYLDFPTFYGYVYDQAIREMKHDPSRDLMPLLEQARVTLFGQ